MQYPRIIYHLTDGTKKSEQGGYTYQQCNSQEELNLLLDDGWRLTPDELVEVAVAEDAEVYETDTPGTAPKPKKVAKKAVKKAAKK